MARKRRLSNLYVTAHAYNENIERVELNNLNTRRIEEVYGYEKESICVASGIPAGGLPDGRCAERDGGHQHPDADAAGHHRSADGRSERADGGGDQGADRRERRRRGRGIDRRQG